VHPRAVDVLFRLAAALHPIARLSMHATRETPRLLLRVPVEADLDDYVAIHGDPDVRRHLTLNGARGGGRSAAWRTLAMVVGHWHLRGYGQFTVIEKTSGAIVGRAGLWYPEGWPGIELGWVIAREHWGKGFATEAARAALEFAFSAAGAPRVISLIQPDNVRSMRVAEKIGQSLEGVTTLDGADMQLWSVSVARAHVHQAEEAAPVRRAGQ
jgi:RimJ/RimL family protein N-acetyltransferase